MIFFFVDFKLFYFGFLRDFFVIFLIVFVKVFKRFFEFCVVLGVLLGWVLSWGEGWFCFDIGYVLVCDADEGEECWGGLGCESLE